LTRLKALAEKTQLSQVEIMTRILHSGIETVHERGFLTLPLKFLIAEQEMPSGGTVIQKAKNSISK
jgi:hypothetical protein